MDPAAPHETIGQRLRRVRVEHGFTQRSLACDGVSHAHISRIEAGTREPSVKALRLLAARLGVSADYLERGVDESDRSIVARQVEDAELTLRLGTDPAVGSRLRELHDEAERLGDRRLAARAAGLAGLAAARDADSQVAIAFLERALADPGMDPVDDPDLAVTLGTTYLGVGRAVDAIALYERCVGSAAARIEGARSARIRFATHLSYALSDDGQFERATALLDTVASEPSADAYSRIRLAWAQARLDAILGRPTEACAHLDTAIGLLSETEDELQRSRAEFTYAEILVMEGQDDEAAAHLERATGIEGAADAAEVGKLRALKALVAIRRGDRDDAAEHVLAALQLMGDTDFGRPVACLALALVHLAGDALPDARHAFEEGIASCVRTQSWTHAVALCSMWADALEEYGLSADAAAARMAAARYAERVPVLDTARA
jgi:transcriptional regulator with XRE-family HTH domain/predicted negative regulator of RcsB-dependent stress response